ncbi:MAG TPA: hypothetical protein VMT28_15830 [Terriglobales bacterium]|jgi:hypothetical protein|nr:hypothetical protein [Terriglobales bacterium]
MPYNTLRGLCEQALNSSGGDRLQTDGLQGILLGSRDRGTGCPVPSLDASNCPVHYAGELGAFLRTAPLPQAPLRLPRREPGAIALGLLWRAEPQDLTKMSADGKLAPTVAGER